MTQRLFTIDKALISGRMEDTPEGFLICRDVPLARTGEQVYFAHEIPGVPAKGGRIVAIRDEDEVFSPDAIESFRGKIFTDDHPDEDVTTANFRTLMRGAVMNPRRGEGSLSDKLLGDIIVYDPATIAKIKAGKREISNGYDADYEILEPGRARQINIRGNHVSLVDEGRCGPTCAIRDKELHMADRKPTPSWKDRLFKALRSKDEAEREEHLAAAEAEMAGDEHTHEGDGHHIVLNVGLPDPAKLNGSTRTESTVDEEGDTPDTEKTDMDEDKVKEICTNAVAEAMGPVTEAMKAITERLDTMATKSEETQEQVENIVEAIDDMADPEDMANQDAIARAAILAPGMTRPVTDAKPGSKSHRDAMGSFKRDALKQALTTDSGRAVVGAVLGHVQPHRIASMQPNEIAVAFRAASQMLLDHNSARTVDTLQSATSGYVRDDKGVPVRPMTPADLQSRANAFYKRG